METLKSILAVGGLGSFYLVSLLAGPVTFVGWFLAKYPADERWWLHAMAISAVPAVFSKGGLVVIIILIGWWAFGVSWPLIGLTGVEAIFLPIAVVAMASAAFSSRR